MPPGHKARRNHDRHVHPQVHRRMGCFDRSADRIRLRHHPDLAGQDRGGQLNPHHGPAAARSTILLVCRPRADNPTPEPWHVVESRIAQAVRADISTLQDYGLSPVDQYLAAFGPALQVISEHWGSERAVSNPDRPDDEFAVTPTDALQVARREVLAHRTREISQSWAESTGDPVTRFYILAQDGGGAATIPFDEANLFARAIGLDLSSNEARRILIAKATR